MRFSWALPLPARRVATAAMGALPALPALFALWASCDADGPTPAAPVASAAPVGAASAPIVVAREIAAAPPELDANALVAALRCASDKARVLAPRGAPEPCAIVERVARAAAAPESDDGCSALPVDSELPATEQRYVGRATRVEGDRVETVALLLKLRRVPESEVGPGQLPFRVGVAIVDDKQAAPAFAAFDSLAAALEKRDVTAVQRDGAAGLTALAALEAWPEAFATRTARGHAYLLAHGGGYVCRGKAGALVVVQRAAHRGAPGDGVFGVVHPAPAN